MKPLFTLISDHFPIMVKVVSLLRSFVFWLTIQFFLFKKLLSVRAPVKICDYKRLLCRDKERLSKREIKPPTNKEGLPIISPYNYLAQPIPSLGNPSFGQNASLEKRHGTIFQQGLFGLNDEKFCHGLNVWRHLKSIQLNDKLLPRFQVRFNINHSPPFGRFKYSPASKNQFSSLSWFSNIFKYYFNWYFST